MRFNSTQVINDPSFGKTHLQELPTSAGTSADSSDREHTRSVCSATDAADVTWTLYCRPNQWTPGTDGVWSASDNCRCHLDNSAVGWSRLSDIHLQQNLGEKRPRLQTYLCKCHRTHYYWRDQYCHSPTHVCHFHLGEYRPKFGGNVFVEVTGLLTVGANVGGKRKTVKYINLLLIWSWRIVRMGSNLIGEP